MRRCCLATKRRLLPPPRSSHGGGGLGQRCRLATLVDWQHTEVLGVLQQTSERGSLEAPLLQRLRGCEQTVEEEQHSEEAGPSDIEVACEWRDFLSAAELCRVANLRDFVLLAKLGDRLCAPETTQAPTDDLIRVGTAFAGLGVLHPPLFAALAQSFLAAWPAAAPAANDSSSPAAGKQLVEVARMFSAQRYRHEELFGRLGQHVSMLGAASLSPGEALSFLHSHAFLRLGGPSPEDGELGEELWQQLQNLVSAGAASSGLVELCYILFLARRVNQERDLATVQELLTKAAPDLLQASHSSWSEAGGPALHQRLLLLRSALRYLHKETYKGLLADLQQLFRRVHRMENPSKELRPAPMFTRKLSAVLTKLKIGNIVNAQRGPFQLDIVERDRKLIYECNHFDRFYTNSIEKIATRCLQERILKAMGYKVVQVPHWQWNKIKHKKQRMEYIRMSRYYAIKDRRELAPRDDKPQDVAVNDFDFLGEYFVRKDMPLASFSWFQPRYDYTKRLPPSSNAAPGSL